MIHIDRKVGESLIIEDPDNGLHYRVVVVRVDEAEDTRLGIEVMGPDELAIDSSSQVEDRSGEALQLKLQSDF